MSHENGGMKSKILNLYAGIGGNRKLWPENLEITAVEMNPEIARIYADNFPDDKIIIGDAHEYLKQYYKDFDFIWSSPPCQTHSSFRQNLQVRFRGVAAEYPDMKLYQEILFLKHNADCLWVVENVVPYYKPLIEGTKIQRHLFWSNFKFHPSRMKHENIRAIQIPELEKLHGFDLSKYKLANKRQILRNCTSPELGLSIFKDAMEACF